VGTSDRKNRRSKIWRYCPFKGKIVSYTVKIYAKRGKSKRKKDVGVVNSAILHERKKYQLRGGRKGGGV
jgi:hypothetical protein